MRDLILKVFVITLFLGLIASLPGLPMEFPIGGLLIFIAIILFVILIITD